MSQQAPQVNMAVILTEDEAGMAKVAVRYYLGKVRKSYRQDVAKGLMEYARIKEERFENALDLYERLGGDPDQVLDLDEIGERHG
jgi:hypothetical protein